MTTGRHMDPGQMDPEFAKFREKRLSGKVDPGRLEPNAKAPVEPTAREGRQITPGAQARPTARPTPPGVIEPNTHAAAGAHRGVATPGEGAASSNMPIFGTAQFQQPKEEPDPRRMKLSDLNLDVVKPPNDHVPIGESLRLIDIALDQAPGGPARPQAAPARPGPGTKTPPSQAARPAPGAPPRAGQPVPRPINKPPSGPAPARPPQARPPVAGAPRPQAPAPTAFSDSASSAERRVAMAQGAPGKVPPRVPSADRVAPQQGLKSPPPARAPRPQGPTVMRTPSGRLVPVRPNDAAPPQRPPVPGSNRTTTRRLKGPRR